MTSKVLAVTLFTLAGIALAIGAYGIIGPLGSVAALVLVSFYCWQTLREPPRS